MEMEVSKEMNHKNETQIESISFQVLALSDEEIAAMDSLNAKTVQKHNKRSTRPKNSQCFSLKYTIFKLS